MKITGELLKAERLSQNLSVNDVAQALKLTQKVINSIEAGDSDALPAKTFVRGFVKSYAELLKLDSSVVLRQFQEEMGSTNPMPKVPPPSPGATPVPPAPAPQAKEQIKSPRPSLKQTSQNFSDNTAARKAQNLNPDNTKSILIMIGGALALILVLVISNHIIESLKNSGATPAPASTAEVTAGPPEVPTPITPPSADTTVSVENTVQAVAAEAAAPPAPNVPEAGFEKSSEKPVEILLEARKDVELFYAKGNSRQFNSLRLSANQVQVLRSKVGLYLKAADGGAFRISVNGIDQGLAGSPNKEVKLSF